MPLASGKTSGTHSPTLDSIRMVEEFIRENSGEYKKTALWKNLPKQMMYQTFMQIIDYLHESGKIAADKKGHICWIYNPEVVNYYNGREDLGLAKHINEADDEEPLKRSDALKYYKDSKESA